MASARNTNAFTTDDENDLKQIFTYAAGDLGLKAAPLQPGVQGGVVDYEPNAAQLRAVKRMRRTGGIISLIDMKYVRVLAYYYGPKDPGARWDVFGDCASIAHLAHVAHEAGRYVDPKDYINHMLTRQTQRWQRDTDASFAERKKRWRKERDDLVERIIKQCGNLLKRAQKEFAIARAKFEENYAEA